MDHAPLIDDPKQMLLDMAQERSAASLLQLIVTRLAGTPAVALARIWLIRPGAGCETCPMQAECFDRSRCLHLVASAGTSVKTIAPDLTRIDGRFRRFPMGVRKVGKIASTGKALEATSLNEFPDWLVDSQWASREGVQGFGGQPLVHRGDVLGVLGVFSRTTIGATCLDWLRMIADHAASALANAMAFEEIDALRKQLEMENDYLREEVRADDAFGGMIGTSEALQNVARQIELVALTDATVLITGESGTGKELVAREIHSRSQRSQRPLIKVNCAAVPRELYESEFFGHTKGAFTSAQRDRVGRFELAHQGTLFLDEVGEIPLDLQSKLLRVLQEGELERVGDEKTRRVDVRIIAATNRNLKQESDAQRFRSDLYYRLSVFPIELPPLRKRKEDIPLLAEHFLKQLARRIGRAVPRLTQSNIQQLQQYDWPGNVREMQHVLERALITSRSNKLRFELHESIKDSASAAASEINVEEKIESVVLTDAQMRAREAENLRRALEMTKGRIYGADGAAQLLGLKPTTLISRIKSLGITAMTTWST